ncbi:hypothetical protein [Sandaracinus amylolyticus]|uniref:Uncharacterized protein n=1 Tax=Sandaracinus amylolyticus TaxID=927083 RepID=A0A0F6W156_9BACT|nr:hypothetical protein [Sandaracinus amylolyticus]AKF04633.1 hypothetical protein DB32_001782 [Sandaracinus amylolyticus]
MRLPLAGAVAGLALLLALAPILVLAQHDAPVATLRVERADDAGACLDEESLRELVAARLGRDPFVDEAPLSITVRIERARRGYVARVDTASEGGEPGRRELTSERDDCRDLGDALALALSLTVDPASLLRPPPRPEANPEAIADAGVVEAPDAGPPIADAGVDAAPPVAPDAGPPPDAANAQDEGDGPALLLTATLLASYGIAPGVSAGLVLGAGVHVDAFSVALELRGELPTVESSVRGAPYVASVVPCGHLDIVGLCGIVSAGVFWGEGVDVPSARSGFAPYVALGARALVAVPLGAELALRLHGELTVPVVGATLQLGGTRAWETPAVGLALGVGVGARLR